MTLTRRDFLKSTGTTAIGLSLPVLTGEAAQQRPAGSGTAPRLQLLRNATCRIRYGGKTILLDPWLSDVGAMPPVNNAPNPRPNPLVALPMPAAQVVAGIDATLLTHTHFDHWDPVAREILPKAGPVLVQPADKDRVAQAGFTDVRVIDSTLAWDGITITRTGAQHGRGAVGQRMGAVSGYVFKHQGSPTLYIAGDTVWCPEVADAISQHAPDVIVVNAGEAQFLEGGPIIMGLQDVVSVCEAAPRATVIAVHFEAVNHCMLNREGLRAGLAGRPALAAKVRIPRDGEELSLA